MYLPIIFESNWDWESFPSEAYSELRSVLPMLPEEKPKWDPGETFYLTQESLPVLAKHKRKFRVDDRAAERGVGSMLVKLQDRIRQLELKSDNPAELALADAAVQIHVPDFCLMQIREVCVLDDCCTNTLQDYLDDGWRILAVCPPNSQRRPDYVLGRSKGK